MLLEEHDYEHIYLITHEGDEPFATLKEDAERNAVGVTSMTYKELEKVSDFTEALPLQNALVIYDDCYKEVMVGSARHTVV
jgi:hypothetical protein